MKNYRPPILQSDWSIASRHGRTVVIHGYPWLFMVNCGYSWLKGN